ncbi:YaiI/YqxD family protein [Pontibacillus yanchengensis]|uniref:UPF0178 protein N782_18035 n=1 Tax=Pontibacillus yanchengensis Y32 TaxID=1385514 RepID=A0A0A2TQJ9_9BACI|nr:YaiI/YqxD family protein [Pontibacillus yanchengensis]KGP71585.1 hypothetical protein N782_18035 [Pontibacillus yanchengensis Y32]
MRIYVDADACPVKEIIIKEAQQFQIYVTMVKSFSHFSHEEDPPMVTTTYVDTGADAADYRIMHLAHKGDLIVTQDYGLAALALGKGCYVIHHKGFSFTTENIDQLLSTRHANAQARKGGMKTKGPKAMNDDDREKFRSVLHSILQRNHEESR